MKKILLLLVIVANTAFGKIPQVPSEKQDVRVVRMYEQGDEDIILLKIDSVLFLVPAENIQTFINKSTGLKGFSVYPVGTDEFDNLVLSSGISDVQFASSMVVAIDEETVLPDNYAKYLRKSK